MPCLMKPFAVAEHRCDLGLCARRKACADVYNTRRVIPSTIAGVRRRLGEAEFQDLVEPGPIDDSVRVMTLSIPVVSSPLTVFCHVHHLLGASRPRLPKGNSPGKHFLKTTNPRQLRQSRPSPEGSIGPEQQIQAMMSSITRPCTSVSRKSRPWNRNVRRSWSSPSRCRIVACRSCT